MKPIQCSSCFKQSCAGGGYQEKDYCASYIHREVFEAARQVYAADPETANLARQAAIIESKGYMVWPRLKDTIELARRMEYTRIAVLFCPDLTREARKTCRFLEESGFDVVSRICGVGKSKPQAPEALMSELKGRNPELIVNAGLCSACEAEILQHADVPVTTYIVRDKKMNHYPASAVYASGKWRDWAKEIYRDKIGLE